VPELARLAAQAVRECRRHLVCKSAVHQFERPAVHAYCLTRAQLSNRSGESKTSRNGSRQIAFFEQIMLRR